MREAVVSGRFYPRNEKELKEKVLENLGRVLKKTEVKGIMVPHAGYIYSGGVAGNVFSYIKPADTYIIIGPNHTGYGEKVSISGEGVWNTPLGDVSVDNEIKDILLEYSDIKEDNYAHRFEHSIEVQLPFLQIINEEFSFVPIVVGRISIEDCKEIANSIAKSINSVKKKITVIASSDMTHYEPHDVAAVKDKKVIDAILDLDSQRMWDIVKREKVSMCGAFPVMIMIEICKKLGADKVEFVDYKTSGDVTGDKSSVVGYGGVFVY